MAAKSGIIFTLMAENYVTGRQLGIVTPEIV
jgi:hypothetical protein